MNLSSRTGCSISRFIVTHATNELHTPNDRTHNDVADCTATGRMRHIRRKMKRKFNIKSGRLQMDGRYYLQMLSECIKCDTHGSFPCPFRRLCPYAEWVADKSTQQNIVADGIAQFQRCRRVLSISMANTWFMAASFIELHEDSSYGKNKPSHDSVIFAILFHRHLCGVRVAWQSACRTIRLVCSPFVFTECQ